MDRWLAAALDYIPRWLEMQMQVSQQPGCAIAIAHRDKVVLERAFGTANLNTGEVLTPRHRFRIASHSKSFTASGIMKLREQRKLALDDAAGDYVEGLHRDVAQATIAQVLSHTAGIIRDGEDLGQLHDRWPYPNDDELHAELKLLLLIIAPGTRMKYSNYGFGLLGLIIKAITGEPYAKWVKREIVDAAGLKETMPDMPLKPGTPFARGHTGPLPLGRRHVIPGDNLCNAIAPAAGFVSTAADLARHFAHLAPNVHSSVLSAASRREITRRHWPIPDSSLEQYYGFGTISGTFSGWDWFGHSGGIQGYISRTCVYPSQELTVCIITNALDGLAPVWVDGAASILQAFQSNGAPSRRTKDWSGRFWSLWSGLDLVPMGNKVMVAAPASSSPLTDASELEIYSRTGGRIALASGFADYGEAVSCVRAKSGRMTEVKLGAMRFYPAARVARELEVRFGKPVRKRRRR